MFNELGGNEFIKFRLLQIHEEFKNRKAVIQRMDKTKNDVTKQLKRIYYLRNKIVHQAQHGEISPRIFMHLIDYIECIICEVLIQIFVKDEVVNLTQILDGYSMALQKKKIGWNNKENLNFSDVIFLSPLL